MDGSRFEPRATIHQAFATDGLWAVTLVPFAALAVGLVVRPELFYDRFLWQYFYGPVVADAHGVASITQHGVTAHSGYTLVNEVGYAYTLAVMLGGVSRLLRGTNVGTRPRFFYALAPYALVGGSVRVVEDAGLASWPAEFFVISPVIYFTMFAATVGVLAVSVWLERRNYVASYAHPLTAIGVLWFFAMFGVLAGHGAARGTLNLRILAAVVLLASGLTAVVWTAITRLRPQLVAGVGTAGLVVLWGHLIDASATSLSIEFLGYFEKHPVVALLIDATGTAYAFVPAKVALVFCVYYLSDADLFEESPRFAHTLLVTVLAVGLGPGTRDVLRAMIGV